MTAPFDRQLLRRFQGAGGSLPRRNIVLVTATLVVLTDTTVGDGGSGDPVDDITVIRDLGTGFPMIEGPSLTGALRAYLSRMPTVPEAAVAAVFGSEDHQARVRPRDAVPAPGYPATGHRESVAVAPGTATAADAALFSSEVVGAGTEFPLVWEIEVPPDPREATPLLEVVVAAATALAQGRIRLGQRTHAGRGRVRGIRWSARLFDMCGRVEDHKVWYSAGYTGQPRLTPPPDPAATPAAALTTALSEWPAPGGAAITFAEPEIAPVGVLELAVHLRNEEVHGDRRVPTAVLLGGPSTGDNLTAALTRPVVGDDGTVREAPIDSGTAALSMLRRTCWQVLTELASASPKPTAALRAARIRFVDLFGSHPADDGTEVQASRIAVDEDAFVGAAVVTLPQVALNPIAHLPISGALAMTQPVFGGGRTVTIQIVDPTDFDLGLFTVVLKELHAGNGARVGADAASGNGRRLAVSVLGRYDEPDGAAPEVVPHRWNSWDEIRGDEWIVERHRRFVEEFDNVC